ncbi:hypothetical protein LCGC14_2209560 [marine sediment metagenome]|uniref:Uncharacterized protein n=1 Tax=marine sediment metagenome TaxID=412755 RepID=A0A0F9G9X7_9ZZZZ
MAWIIKDAKWSPSAPYVKDIFKLEYDSNSAVVNTSDFKKAKKFESKQKAEEWIKSNWGYLSPYFDVAEV